MNAKQCHLGFEVVLGKELSFLILSAAVTHLHAQSEALECKYPALPTTFLYSTISTSSKAAIVAAASVPFSFAPQ
jgi:hypothetical protein